MNTGDLSRSEIHDACGHKEEEMPSFPCSLSLSLLPPTISSSSRAIKKTTGGMKPFLTERALIERCRSSSLTVEDALNLFNAAVAADPKPSIYAINLLLAAIARMKHHPVVISLCNKLNLLSGIQPSASTYSVVIKSCCGMSSVDLGFSVFGGLLKRGLSPSTTMFNHLINGLCSEKRIREAAMLFDKMSLMGCEPNVFSCNALIKGLCNTGSTALALELHQKMALLGDSCKPDLITYNTIVHHLCKEGHVSDACKLLEKMMDQSFTPDVVTFSMLMGALSKHGKTAEWFKDRLPDSAPYNVLCVKK